MDLQEVCFRVEFRRLRPEGEHTYADCIECLETLTDKDKLEIIFRSLSDTRNYIDIRDVVTLRDEHAYIYEGPNHWHQIV